MDWQPRGGLTSRPLTRQTFASGKRKDTDLRTLKNHPLTNVIRPRQTNPSTYEKNQPRERTRIDPASRTGSTISRNFWNVHHHQSSSERSRFTLYNNSVQGRRLVNRVESKANVCHCKIRRLLLLNTELVDESITRLKRATSHKWVCGPERPKPMGLCQMADEKRMRETRITRLRHHTIGNWPAK